ncbi:hypothetical protein CsSME_00045737 [Camellia sinensis var. sinensis]
MAEAGAKAEMQNPKEQIPMADEVHHVPLKIENPPFEARLEDASIDSPRPVFIVTLATASEELNADFAEPTTKPTIVFSYYWPKITILTDHPSHLFFSLMSTTYALMHFSHYFHLLLLAYA